MQHLIRWSIAPISASLFLSGLLFILPFAGDPAFAADEEMIITTRKKEENLMDVPVAVTAFDAQELEEAGIRTMDDVANFTPGLNFFNPIGDFLPVPVIRGIAPTDIFGENNAAMFVDGVYVSGREGLNFSQLDLERVEVNKGPQAALYGRNAFSGAINFITAKPTEEFGAKASVRAGDRGVLVGKVAVSGPLFTEKLKGRIAFAHDEWDGSYDDPVSGVDVGGAEYDTFQGSLLWDPTDSLSFLLNAYYSDDQINANATSSLAANCENTNFADPTDPPRLANFCGEVPELPNENIAKIASATGEDRELTRVNLNIDWDIGIGTITSLTGYSDTEQKSATDGNRDLAEDLPFVYCETGVFGPGLCAFGPPQVFTTGLLQLAPEPDTTEEISQEFRFSSEVGRISYDVGVYYFNVESEARELGVIATQPLPANFEGFGPFLPPGTIFPGSPALPIGTDAYIEWFQPGGDVGGGLALKDETESWSVFGTFGFAFTDRLNGRAELRYADEEKDRLIIGGDIDGSDLMLNDSWDMLSWRLNLDYSINDAWMIYGSVAQAEKPGKFDTNSADVITDTTTVPPTTEERVIVLKVQPEKNTTYEIGAKGSFWDDRATLRTAVYYTDWEDIVIPQVLESDPTSGLPFQQPESFDLNAGSADILGAEVESDFIISDSWGFNIGVSYTDSELKNNPDGHV